MELFSLYQNGDLVRADVNYNEALGFLYRSQGWGASEKPGFVDVFAIRGDLADKGWCQIDGAFAISRRLTRAVYTTAWAAQTAARILAVAGHFE